MTTEQLTTEMTYTDLKALQTKAQTKEEWRDMSEDPTLTSSLVLYIALSSKSKSGIVIRMKETIHVKKRDRVKIQAHLTELQIHISKE